MKKSILVLAATALTLLCTGCIFPTHINNEVHQGKIKICNYTPVSVYATITGEKLTAKSVTSNLVAPVQKRSEATEVNATFEYKAGVVYEFFFMGHDSLNTSASITIKDEAGNPMPIDNVGGQYFTFDAESDCNQIIYLYETWVPVRMSYSQWCTELAKIPEENEEDIKFLKNVYGGSEPYQGVDPITTELLYYIVYDVSKLYPETEYDNDQDMMTAVLKDVEKIAAKYGMFDNTKKYYYSTSGSF